MNWHNKNRTDSVPSWAINHCPFGELVLSVELPAFYIRIQVWSSAIPLLLQLPVNTLGKAVGQSSILLVSATLTGGRSESWLLVWSWPRPGCCDALESEPEDCSVSLYCSSSYQIQEGILKKKKHLFYKSYSIRVVKSVNTRDRPPSHVKFG